MNQLEIEKESNMVYLRGDWYILLLGWIGILELSIIWEYGSSWSR